MKRSKTLFEETMDVLVQEGYRVVYVPHNIIEDYNATYNVVYQGKQIVTNAAKELGIPIGEIWVSELWGSYEKFILFHELREIGYRAEGLSRDEAHEKTRQDEAILWTDDSFWRKMNRDIAEKDRETAERKRRT